MCVWQLILAFLCPNFLLTREEKYDFARVTLERRVVDAVEKVVHQNRMGDNAGFVRTGHGSDIHSALGIREKVWGGLKVLSTLLELG
jgi:hypothetical protein